MAKTSNSFDKDSSVDGTSKVTSVSLNNSVLINGDGSLLLVLNINKTSRNFVFFISLNRLLKVEGLFSVEDLHRVEWRNSRHVHLVLIEFS